MPRGGSRPGAGRKPGSFAQHTLMAQETRKRLIEMYQQAADNIHLVLIKKALDGDIIAIKELMDRVHGKAYQSGDLDVTSNGGAIQITDEQYKQALAAAVKRSGGDESST